MPSRLYPQQVFYIPPLEGGLETVACRGCIALTWIVPSSVIWPIGFQQGILHTFLSLLLQTTHVCNRELSCKRQTLNHEPAKSCDMVPSSVSLERLCDVAFLFQPFYIQHLSLAVVEFCTTTLPPPTSHRHQVFHTKAQWNVKTMIRSRLRAVNVVLIREAEVGSVAWASKSRKSSQNISSSKSNAAVWRYLLHLSSKQEETLLLF